MPVHQPHRHHRLLCFDRCVCTSSPTALPPFPAPLAKDICPIFSRHRVLLGSWHCCTARYLRLPLPQGKRAEYDCTSDTLSVKESSDLIVAAVGLLNLKGALVACFAGMLFCIILSLIFFICCCGKDQHNHLDKILTCVRGSYEYETWRAIYERIESSTLNDVLRLILLSHLTCLTRADAAKRPAPASCMDSNEKQDGDSDLEDCNGNQHKSNIRCNVVYSNSPAAECGSVVVHMAASQSHWSNILAVPLPPVPISAASQTSLGKVRTCRLVCRQLQVLPRKLWCRSLQQQRQQHNSPLRLKDTKMAGW